MDLQDLRLCPFVHPSFTGHETLSINNTLLTLTLKSQWVMYAF